MKLLYLTNIPSPYRVRYFNELGRHCDLTVLFERNSADGRDDSWKDVSFRNFRGIVLPGKAIGEDKAFCPAVRTYLTAEWDRIVCCNAMTPTGIFAIQTMKRRKLPYFIEGDGGYAGSGSGVKERFKRHVISGAAGYFSTSAEHDRYYLTYGAEKENIHRYPFTSLSEDDLSRAHADYDKAAVKERLGMTEENIVLAVGRFIPVKGFEVLLAAAAGLPSSVGCYIVGGTPTEEYKQIVTEKNLTNVHFVDFRKSEALTDYYRAADVFTLPTRGDVWGLVVNEAMAFSLPVVTTDRCIAGLELVRDGENGYIVPTDDETRLCRAITDVLADEARRKAMGERSFDVIRGYTVETMVKAHLAVLEK